MVNLEWYRSFVEVYQVGTASGAAKVLHLTQPAVSQHIAALESALGETLFHRMPRRMTPTAAGKRLYSQVVVAIETLESVSTNAAGTDRPQRIRLGSPAECFCEYVLGHISNIDTLQLSVQFGLAAELIDCLLSKQIDGAIATQKIDRPDLKYQPIFQEHFWLVGPPNYEPTASDTLQPHNLSKLEKWLSLQPWISYSEDLPIVRRFWQTTFGKRLECEPQVIIPDLRSIRAAIARGLGFSVLPDYLCRSWIADNRLTLVLQPQKAVTNTIWLAYRKREQQSPQIRLLIDSLTSQKNSNNDH